MCILYAFKQHASEPNAPPIIANIHFEWQSETQNEIIESEKANKRTLIPSPAHLNAKQTTIIISVFGWKYYKMRNFCLNTTRSAPWTASSIYVNQPDSKLNNSNNNRILINSFISFFRSHICLLSTLNAPMYSRLFLSRAHYLRCVLVA